MKTFKQPGLEHKIHLSCPHKNGIKHRLLIGDRDNKSSVSMQSYMYVYNTHSPCRHHVQLIKPKID